LNQDQQRADMSAEHSMTATSVRRQFRSMAWCRTLVVVIVCLWILAWPVAVVHALSSDWAPWGEVPTAIQQQRAIARAQVAAALGIALPVLASGLAAWCRMRVTAGLLAVGAAFAALLSLFIISLATGPTRSDPQPSPSTGVVCQESGGDTACRGG
jgi:hypothetical protein